MEEQEHCKYRLDDRRVSRKTPKHHQKKNGKVSRCIEQCNNSLPNTTNSEIMCVWSRRHARTFQKPYEFKIRTDVRRDHREGESVIVSTFFVSAVRGGSVSVQLPVLFWISGVMPKPKRPLTYARKWSRRNRKCQI